MVTVAVKSESLASRAEGQKVALSPAQSTLPATGTAAAPWLTRNVSVVKVAQSMGRLKSTRAAPFVATPTAPSVGAWERTVGALAMPPPPAAPLPVSAPPVPAAEPPCPAELPSSSPDEPQAARSGAITRKEKSCEEDFM